MKTQSFSIKISDSIGSVSAEVYEPMDLKAMMALAHGAGANMDHHFMKGLAQALADQGIGSLRFNFPYMEKGKGRPDPPAIAEKTAGVVLEKTHELYPETLLLGAGKSFGGRMISQYVSKAAPSFLKGIVFYGFPLHPAGKPSTERAAHLSQISLPMLFLQGTRDALANLSLISSVTSGLSGATVSLFEGADHSFSKGKKVFIPELALATRLWSAKLS
jgi:predicted alpha/beta-hydrolase family hydrolase